MTPTPSNDSSPKDLSRRTFLVSGAVAGPLLFSLTGRSPAADGGIAPAGPGAKYTPRLQVAFVRRKEDYGMLWPGAIYDGAAALKDYRRKIEEAARELGMEAEIRPEPIHSMQEADAWLARAKGRKPDGLLVVLLDRQKHSWPTAARAAGSGIPTVIFAPVGTAFTTNTTRLASQDGVFICSTDDFRQAAFGMKMVRAAAKLREMRFLVLRGNKRRDVRAPHFGTRLRYVPAADFLQEYRRTPTTDEIKVMADEYVQAATRLSGPAIEDVRNGIKSYVVARTLLEREEADGITMDCLGALGKTSVSLPCIAWSRMLDQGIPAACEADVGAALTHTLVQLLFDRPGFQQDPVPETARGCLVGAHCTCATRLKGFSEPREPFDLSHHHGNRDAVPRPVWKVGQRMTVADILDGKSPSADGKAAGEPPTLLVSTGTVVDNVAVPPSGGCVVSVMVKLDGVTDYLAYPGFHQIFFYGDFGKELVAYGKLFGLATQVV